MKRLIASVLLILGLAACGGTTTIIKEVPVTPKPAHSVQPKPVTTPSPTPTQQPARQGTASPLSPSAGQAQVAAPPIAQAAPGNPYTDQGFNDLYALQQSVANEQATELNAAPSSDFYYPGAGTDTVYATCNYLRMDTYSCTATDSVGDIGSADYVTPSSDGSSWSDTGMTWTGPDVTSGSYTVSPENGWTSS
jgi:hypothetical protein